MSDFFVTGVNAVTERERSIGSTKWACHGGVRTRKVVIVAGRNKVVADRNAAERIRRIAAPQHRPPPGIRTPCAKTGVCSDCNGRTGSTIPGWRCCAAGPTNGC